MENSSPFGSVEREPDPFGVAKGKSIIKMKMKNKEKS